MASMSPPASSEAPTPVKKRGRPAGGGKKKVDGETPRGSGSGRGRKKRQSTVDSASASTPVAGGLSMHTPGGGSSSHAPSPGMSNIGSILENDMRNMREGSHFSASRKGASNNKRDGTVGARGETGTQADPEEDDDEDDDDEDDEEFNLGDVAYDEQAKERAEAKEALRLLLDQFGPEQLERYETYRRSGLPGPAVRRLINHVLQQSCAPSIVTGFRGISKVFVGEIVELARQVQAEADESGPLTPDHLREAYIRYKSVKDKRGSSRSKLFVR